MIIPLCAAALAVLVLLWLFLSRKKSILRVRLPRRRRKTGIRPVLILP